MHICKCMCCERVRVVQCVRHMSERRLCTETGSEGACKGHAERKRLCWYSLAGSDIVESALLFSSLSSCTPAHCLITLCWLPSSFLSLSYGGFIDTAHISHDKNNQVLPSPTQHHKTDLTLLQGYSLRHGLHVLQNTFYKIMCFLWPTFLFSAADKFYEFTIKSNNRVKSIQKLWGCLSDIYCLHDGPCSQK